MATIKLNTSLYEKRLAELFDLDLAEVQRGSINVESSPGGDLVSWSCVRRLPAGTVHQIITEIAERQRGMTYE